ncbi:MAG: zinc ribbon domain-containing protein, partial [Candidatus Bathyarchaeia archaeon]
QVKTATATLTVNEEADFSISITPPERTLNQGESTTFTVTLNEIGEFNEQVTLTASGLPTGATPNFGPTSGTPTFTSTLNINTLESTPAGSYTVNVDASGGGKSHSATASITIKEKSNETTPGEEETTQDEDNGTNGLPTSEILMNPTNLMLIVIAILVIALIVMMVRRGRTPTIEKTGTSTPTMEKTDTSVDYCTKCGAQIKPGTTFCSSCGTPI